MQNGSILRLGQEAKDLSSPGTFPFVQSTNLLLTVSIPGLNFVPYLTLHTSQRNQLCLLMYRTFGAKENRKSDEQNIQRSLLLS